MAEDYRKDGKSKIYCYLWMMEREVLMMSLSGTYREQGFLQWLQENGKPVRLLDAEDWEGTRCYCSQEAAERLMDSLPLDLPKVRWIDSGDYHYMSHLLALREKEPFHLVLLDHHPDNQEPAFGDVLSCGSWVKVFREQNPKLEDILCIGPEGCPEDIPDGWLESRRGERLYVSLDKDIMSQGWARTDWTQGSHTLPQVKAIMGRLLEEGNVVAVDICGELQESKGASAEDLRINKETNIELYNYITAFFN